MLEDKSYHSAAESFTEQEKENSSDKEQYEQDFVEPDQDSTSDPDKREPSPEPERFVLNINYLKKLFFIRLKNLVDMVYFLVYYYLF